MLCLRRSTYPLRGRVRKGEALKSRILSSLTSIFLTAVVGMLAVGISFSLYYPGQAGTALPYATLKVIAGEALVQREHSLVWEKATSGMKLGAGSRVKTGSGSRASITFLPGVTTTLEPGTGVILTWFETGGDGSASVRVRQEAGRTWNQVRRPDGGCQFQLDTPSAAVTVHGTLFAVGVDGSGETSVQTLEGAVSLRSRGQEVVIPAGWQARAGAGGPPSEPGLLPP
ncbi:MAG: FecR family protein [Dehalococcoidales bacterium]|nr:FecR family protein [Dehalococcoidales bacterium]